MIKSRPHDGHLCGDDDPESMKRICHTYSDYLSDSSTRLHTGKVQNPERGGLYIFGAWFFVCSGLNYMMTESDQLWKPDKRVWDCER